MVTVYTKPDCHACRLTKIALDKAGIPYVEAPLEDEVLEAAKADGILSAPIVTYPSGKPGIMNWFGGFRPDKLTTLRAD